MSARDEQSKVEQSNPPEKSHDAANAGLREASVANQRSTDSCKGLGMTLKILLATTYVSDLLFSDPPPNFPKNKIHEEAGEYQSPGRIQIHHFPCQQELIKMGSSEDYRGTNGEDQDGNAEENEDEEDEKRDI